MRLIKIDVGVVVVMKEGWPNAGGRPGREAGQSHVSEAIYLKEEAPLCDAARILH